MSFNLWSMIFISWLRVEGSDCSRIDSHHAAARLVGLLQPELGLLHHRLLIVEHDLVPRIRVRALDSAPHIARTYFLPGACLVSR